jgi:hypothetical protein
LLKSRAEGEIMKHLPVLSVLMCALGLTSACTAPIGSEPSASVRNGLEVLESDDAAGKLVLAFRKDGRTIRYELRLGEKLESTSPANDGAPELPASVVDARVLDAQGGVFYMQRGGDEFIDPSWHMPKVENFDLEGRLIDVKLPRDAVAELRTLHLGPRLDDLRKTAIQIGLSVDNMYEKDDVTEPSTTTVGAEQRPALAPKDNYVYAHYAAKWDYVIRRQPSGLFIGEHSAVWLRAWHANNWVVANFYSCNHGACANWSTMGTKCVMSGWRYDDGTRWRTFFSETSTSTSYRNGACGSSWGLWPGQHTCNNDSILQRDSIYYDTLSSTWTCSNPYVYAPGCH